MPTITATKARKDLYRLVDHVQDTHEPVEIAGKRGNAVLHGVRDRGHDDGSNGVDGRQRPDARLDRR